MQGNKVKFRADCFRMTSIPCGFVYSIQVNNYGHCGLKVILFQYADSHKQIMQNMHSAYVQCIILCIRVCTCAWLYEALCCISCISCIMKTTLVYVHYE